MKEKLIKIFSSYKTTILLLIIYAVLMSAATIIEKYSGTAVAKALIYYSPLFILLHLLMVINFIFITIKHKLFNIRKWGYLLVHGAFIVILIGASITHFFGKEGMLHLREGEKSNVILIRKGNSNFTETLPFEVELTDFNLERYPGSQSPSSYESHLRLYVDGQTMDKDVYMNHVLDLKGYRFFQASYDSDEMGSILSVSYDVAGRRVTYTGYTILLAGLIGCLLGKGSRFRTISRKLKVLPLLLLFFSSAEAGEIPDSHLKTFGEMAMQSQQGRIMPINTFAHEIVRKLQTNDLNGYSSVEFLLHLISEPERFANEPLIKIKDKELRQYITNGNEYVSYRASFDKNGNYRFTNEVENAYIKNPAERTHFDKEMMKFDEKVNILHQLFNFKLIRIFPVPDDSINHTWIAPGDNLSQLSAVDSTTILNLFNTYRKEVAQSLKTNNWSKADNALNNIVDFQYSTCKKLNFHIPNLRNEAIYNDFDLLNQCKKGYLITGGLLLILSFIMLLKDENKQKPYKIIKKILIVCVIIFFTLHSLNLYMRWLISGFVPWSNAYETMVTLAWATILGGLIFARRSLIVFALSTLFAGVVLFVSSLNWMDPQITPLVPVLKSPWLMSHVITLICAYGFFGISCMIATTNLLTSAFINKNNKELLNNSHKC